ncbi:MAG: endonuclease V [Nitrososphaerales archaeon]
MPRADPDLKEFITLLQTRIPEIPPRRYVKIEDIKTVCGVDVSYRGGRAAAAAVLWSVPKQETVEVSVHTGQPPFPYIPGLLFMREAPLMTAAIKDLSGKPDIILVDGHGIAHPRRAGLAVFVGLILDTPSLGVAKSRLVGEVGEVEDRFAPLILDGSTVGFMVESAGRRFFISPGYGVQVGSIRGILRHIGEEYPKVLLEADRISRESMI